MPQINILILLHCVFRVFVISFSIVKNSLVNVIKGFSVFGFISMGEAAGEKGVLCCQRALQRSCASPHLGLLSESC